CPEPVSVSPPGPLSFVPLSSPVHKPNLSCAHYCSGDEPDYQPQDAVYDIVADESRGNSCNQTSQDRARNRTRPPTLTCRATHQVTASFFAIRATPSAIITAPYAPPKIPRPK